MDIERFYTCVTPEHDFSALQNSRATVVISPHPDDDVIGMGGTMAIQASRGKVVTIFMTDGSGSLRDCPKEEIPQARKKEALNALKIVKAEGAFFLGVQSDYLAERKAEYERMKASLSAIFRWISPQGIYVTSPFEIHPTHIRCTRCVVEVLQEMEWGTSGVRLYGYPVWGPLFGPKKNIVRQDITSFASIKKDSILAHAGEVGYKPYHEGVLARNRYQAVFENPHETTDIRFLELFLDMSGLLDRPYLSLEEYAHREMIAYACEIGIKP